MKFNVPYAVIILLCVITVSVPGALYAGTIAHWNFEDGSPGEEFSDQPSGGSVGIANGYIMYGYDATYGPNYSADGETPTGSGLSAEFNGSEDGYTTNSTLNNWSPSTWTIEVSVKLDTLSGWNTIIGRDGSTQGDSESDFYLQNNGIDDAFRVNFSTVGGDRYILDSNFTPQANKWYNLAIVSDGEEVTMYSDEMDGTGYEQVGSLQMEQSISDNALNADSYNWTFGRGWYNGDFVDHISGNLDDIRFSDTALSPRQFLHYTPVHITESDGLTILYPGNPNQVDDYDIVLVEEPSDNVDVTVDPPAGINAGNGPGAEAVLTFTPSNWNQPQSVEIEIADPEADFNDTEIVEHTVQSNDSLFDGVSVSDVTVNIQKDECGMWGYLPSDYNFDCISNLEDFSMLADLWLTTDAPLDIQPFVQDWLINTISYDQNVYSRSIDKPDQNFFVNTANVQNNIDEKIYGHFLEHIYHSTNGGLWGDLVWNRSFESVTGGGSGIWSTEGDELVQSSMATDVHFEFGAPSWQDYELTLEARKDGGNEGFLIVFRSPDSDNLYWLNLGGWGNSEHAVEKEVNGNRSSVTPRISGSINTGQWYDIRIRCEGNNFQVWLDGTQIFDFTDTDGAFTNGRVGVGTWETEARYRNIEVTRISDSTVLYSGLPDIPETQYLADFWDSFGDGQFTLSTDALNDDYSIQIDAPGGSTGIQQDDYKFTQQPYSGSLWMKGSLPAGLKVQLMDGSTVLGEASIPAPNSVWSEYEFQITPSARTEQGTLRINLQGAGNIYLDQVSMMSQSAIDTGGYRPDLLKAVADLKPPVIRWPGGCYASAYLWKDGIGPQHTRHKYPIRLWDDQDTNSYGTDEFLRMCEKVGAEPIIVVNSGVLDSTCGVSIPDKLPEDQYLQDALDWMEYCNGSTDTTWGAKRAENGHPEPYNVKYWEIDNETWSAGVSAYIDKVQEFAPAMRAYDPNIKIIACGSGSYDSSWNEAVIDNCADLIDYISVHHYEGADGYKSGPGNYEGFIESLGDYIESSSNPDIKIYMSEWNAQTTDFRTGLYAGGLLNAFMRQGDVFEIGGPALFLRHLSAGGWDNAFINFDHTGWFPAPNYVVMKLWREHYAPKRVETTGGSGNLNVASTMSEYEKTLNIHIVNPDSTDRTVEFEIDNSFVPEKAYMHYVETDSLYARNTLENPHNIHQKARVIGIDGQTLRFIMPGYSAGVVTVKTTQPHKTEFLYSSFRGNGEDGLHLAHSEDGLTFTALKNDESFLAPQVGSGLMRDPSICQGPDGMFHMVWTTGWNDDGIGIAHSPDLINWSEQTYLPVMGHEPNAQNCWAPEIFYDDDTDKYLIFWSTTIEGAFPETYNPNDDNNHRIYYVSTEDFQTYTDTELFYDPGFNVIDGFIAETEDRYVMFVKNETKAPTAEKNICMTFSENAAGPYGPASEPVTPPSLWVEGPSAVKIGQLWYLYYDAYTEGYMGAQTSPDLENWTDVTGDVSFPSGTRHGTVFRVSEDVVENLQNQ